MKHSIKNILYVISGIMLCISIVLCICSSVFSGMKTTEMMYFAFLLFILSFVLMMLTAFFDSRTNILARIGIGAFLPSMVFFLTMKSWEWPFFLIALISFILITTGLLFGNRKDKKEETMGTDAEEIINQSK